MADIILSRLEQKLQLLLKKMQFLQEENSHLEKDLAQKKEKLQIQENQLEEMEHQMALQKIAASTGRTKGVETDPNDRTELKRTLNKYIREIDHCIARLNE